jgi:RNA polymerase sigma-70 factor (family 1)
LPTNAPHNEKELLRLVAEGDELAFRQLFENYTPKLKAFFLKMTKETSLARELVQETFLNIWLYRDSLAAVEKPSTYIYRIASNVAIAHFRKEDLQRKLVAAMPDTEPVDERDSHGMLRLKEVQEIIDTAVKQLPPQQQQVFRLSREQGLSRTEIANKLGLAEKTVRNHLSLSLKSIQQFLRENHLLYIPLFFLMSILMKN